MTTSIILRCADEEIVDFARSVIGMEFHEHTAHTEQCPALVGNGVVTTNKETKLKEEYDFAKGEFYKFVPGECVVCRQGTGYV